MLLKTPPGRDRYGDPLPGDGVTRVVDGCNVYPRTSSEDDDRGVNVITGLTALLPIPAADVNADMLVVHKGVEYEVEGDPGEWGWMSGDFAATQIALKKATAR